MNRSNEVGVWQLSVPRGGKLSLSARLRLDASGISFECLRPIEVKAEKEEFAAATIDALSMSMSKTPSNCDEDFVLVWPFHKKPVSSRRFEKQRTDGIHMQDQTDVVGERGMQKINPFESLDFRLGKEF